MAIENLIRAVLTATPATQRELERIIRGKTADLTMNTDNDERRLVSISGTARLLALGRSTVYRLIETGRLDTVDLNGSKRITMRSICQFIDGDRPINEKTAALVAANKARYAAETRRKDIK